MYMVVNIYIYVYNLYVTVSVLIVREKLSSPRSAVKAENAGHTHNYLLFTEINVYKLNEEQGQ
jgi:hypothetical protein